MGVRWRYNLRLPSQRRIYGIGNNLGRGACAQTETRRRDCRPRDRDGSYLHCAAWREGERRDGVARDRLRGGGKRCGDPCDLVFFVVRVAVDDQRGPWGKKGWLHWGCWSWDCLGRIGRTGAAVAAFSYRVLSACSFFFCPDLGPSCRQKSETSLFLQESTTSLFGLFQPSSQARETLVVVVLAL